MERPFTIAELEVAVEAAAADKSPGVDGLSYEFYKRTLPLVGPALLAACNAMLEDGLLSPSMRHGLVRLLPKVPGVPAAHQLRPITLLCTDYKLLSKMLVGRLLPLLPAVISSNQLCSVQGRSVFEGPATVLSAAEYLRQRGQPGFLLSLDFFHAYDRVSLPWVDQVLAAMGFGVVFRSWVAALHRGASASFLLHALSRPLEILFSIRQGDPLSSLLFVIYVEPFLRRLERELTGLQMLGGREVGFGYMDDVEVLSGDLDDLGRVDVLCRRFEAAAGAILNRNRKTVLLGLGAWADRRAWPLEWLHCAPQVKVLGFVMTADIGGTVDATWERVAAGVSSTLKSWQLRRLPALWQRAQVATVYALSRIWYFCQVLWLPPVWAAVFRKAVREFVWKDRFERLAMEELHVPLAQGGLSIPCIQTRAQSLLAKQCCHFIGGGGRLAVHLSFWLGPRLRHLVPALPRVLIAPGEVPAHYRHVAAIIAEAVTLPAVNVEALEWVQSRLLYAAWMTDPPPPKVEFRLPHIPWRRSWARLAAIGDRDAQDLYFSALHDILPTPEREVRLGLRPAAACPACAAAVAGVLHVFTGCPRVSAAWHSLLFRASLALGLALTDQSLFYLAWEPRDTDAAVVFALQVYASWVWESAASPAPLNPAVLARKVSAAAAAAVQVSLFRGV